MKTGREVVGNSQTCWSKSFSIQELAKSCNRSRIISKFVNTKNNNCIQLAWVTARGTVGKERKKQWFPHSSKFSMLLKTRRRERSLSQINWQNHHLKSSFSLAPPSLPPRCSSDGGKAFVQIIPPFCVGSRVPKYYRREKANEYVQSKFRSACTNKVPDKGMHAKCVSEDKQHDPKLSIGSERGQQIGKLGWPRGSS